MRFHLPATLLLTFYTGSATAKECYAATLPKNTPGNSYVICDPNKNGVYFCGGKVGGASIAVKGTLITLYADKNVDSIIAVYCKGMVVGVDAWLKYFCSGGLHATWRAPPSCKAGIEQVIGWAAA